MATLYGNADNFRTQLVLAAAKFGKTKVNLKNETPPTAVSPLGHTPALERGDKHFCSVMGMAVEVGGEGLRGQKPEHLSQVVGWLSHAESQFLPAVLGWVLPSQSLVQMDKKSIDQSKAELLGMLGVVDKYLLTRTFLVGERLSLADLALAFSLLPAFQHVLDGSARKDLVNVTRWFNTVFGQPEVKDVVGSVQLCEVAAQFDGKKYKELQASISGESGTSEKKGGGKKDKKPEAKPKKEEPEELDAGEEVLAAEPKKKDPFEDFPKLNFNFDEFKRIYSNEDTVEKAIPYFWETFEADKMSLWSCEYKYNSELTLVFMSCNLISGMFQRLDKMRKNSFGSMILFGENNKSSIHGLWFWKGDKLAFELSPDWQIDFDSYAWTKLDPADPKTKKMVTEYLTWEGDFDGKKMNQGKIFK